MTNPFLIGVVGSPSIAQALKSLGFEVVTGPSGREAAVAISHAMKDGGFPLVVADGESSGMNAWVTVNRTRSPRMVLVGTPSIGGIAAEFSDLLLTLPATFNDLLDKLGYQRTDRPQGSIMINSLGVFGEPEPAVDEDPEPTSAPVPAALPVPESMPAAARTANAPVFGAPAQPTVGAPTAPREQREVHEALQPPTFGGQPATVEAVTPDNVLEPADAPPPPAFTVPGVSPQEAAVAEEFGWKIPSPAVVESAPPAAAVEAPEEPPTHRDTYQAEPVPVQPTTPTAIDRTAPSRRAAIGSKHGEVIICAAGKGGVGKTVTSLLIADVAAEMGLTAVLVDGNRGQADIRKYLRLDGGSLRTVYDAYETNDPSQALLKPKDFAHLRAAAHLDQPDFGLVLGPPSDLADPRFASANVYGDIIDYARTIADLVIVDTQIIEAHRTDLWNHTMLPLLIGDAWLVGITDESSTGIQNLYDRLGELRLAGVRPDRTLILASQFLAFDGDDVNYFKNKYDGRGIFIGNTGIDDDFHLRLNTGRVWSQSPAIRPAIDAILARTTGRDDLFGENAPAGKAARAPKTEKRGWFGKKRG